MPGVIIFLHTNANFVFPSMLCQLPQQFQFLRSDMSTPQLVQNKHLFMCFSYCSNYEAKECASNSSI